jgi:GAF domain-containing protein
MNKHQLYEALLLQAQGLLEEEQTQISIYANISALIKMTLPYVSWAGFYLKTEEAALTLGPFQGQVACVHIPFARGVCGKAAREQKTAIVDDVHAFPGHIACDAQSRSEIVVPLLKAGTLLAVLDLDSYEPRAFDKDDQHYLEQLLTMVASR